MSGNSLEYAQMIEIPVNTCTVTHKKMRKSKRRTEDLKAKAIESVNKRVESGTTLQAQKSPRAAVAAPFKFNIIMFEFVIICALCAVIFLTSIFVPNSGINTFLRTAFGGSSTEQIKEKEYDEYMPSAPVLNYSALSLENGVMTFDGSASIYSPLDGVVSTVIEGEDGRYILEIAHTGSFKTVISGASFAYFSEGDSVYKSIPVAFVKDGEVNFYMYNDGSLLSNYSLSDGNIIWQV